MGQARGLEPPNTGTTTRGLNHLATPAIEKKIQLRNLDDILSRFEERQPTGDTSLNMDDLEAPDYPITSVFGLLNPPLFYVLKRTPVRLMTKRTRGSSNS